MEDVYSFINQYLIDNPDPTGPFKYGKVRIDASRLIDLSPTSADTIKYLDDRALDLKIAKPLVLISF